MQIKNRQDFNLVLSMNIYKYGRTGKFVKNVSNIYRYMYINIFLETCIEARHKNLCVIGFVKQDVESQSV